MLVLHVQVQMQQQEEQAQVQLQQVQVWAQDVQLSGGVKLHDAGGWHKLAVEGGHREADAQAILHKFPRVVVERPACRQQHAASWPQVLNI